MRAGCFAGCSGKPRNTSPRTPGIGSFAAAFEVIRPPNDFPPAKSGSSGARRAASAQTERTYASQTGCGSGRRPPRSV